jgi:Flp pilus assembly secretin CpaC
VFSARFPHAADMKYGLFAAVAGFLGVVSLATSEAQNGDFDPLGPEVPIDHLPKQMRIQVEWIELSHEDMTALLAPPDPIHPITLNSGNDGPLRVKLTEMIKEGKARILDTSMVVAKSGQRAKTESIREVIYPSEYDPADAKTGDASEEAGSGNGSVVLVPPNPAAFECRNVGSTLEVDPVIGADGVTIDLNLNPEIVYFLENLNFGEYEVDGAKVDIVMPVFYTMRVTTSLTVMAGQYSFVGVQSPFNEETLRPDPDRKVMVFVKADIFASGMPVED